jgi:hypothetical protein
LALLVDQDTAKQLGVVETVKVRRNAPVRIHMADGSSADLKQGHIELVWNGVSRRVAVGITSDGQLFADDGSWPDSEPKALLGCQLMAGNIVTINFCTRTIEMSDCTSS